MLLHGRLDVFWAHEGRAFVLDYKTTSLAEGTPEELVEADYSIQRLVYALACFRTGADEVEVVYHFLERPGRGRRDDVPPARTRPRSRRSSRRRSPASRPATSGPTPGEFACAGCPALDRVCAGPRLLVPAA